MTPLPVFAFNEEKHFYTLDDKPVSGVTTILRVIAKPALIQWAADTAVAKIEQKYKTIDWTNPIEVKKLLAEAKAAHTKKKEKAGDWGKIVHKAIEFWIGTKQVPSEVTVNGVTYKIEKVHRESIDNFIGWAELNNVEFLESEKMLYSLSGWYAGTADFVAKINGQVIVGDVKTGSHIYPEAFIQCSAYAKALEEMGLHKAVGAVVVNCRKDGSFDYRFNWDIEENYECFKACIVINRRINELKK